MNLQKEIDSRRKEIQTAAYPMSVGELANLYRDGDLDIHPEFQRFFRWTQSQKSRFIESLLLGIPIPSIFVFQRKDGVWDLIDGLQRVSTILEFMGELRGEGGVKLPGLALSPTEYLTSLGNVYWSSEVIGFDQDQGIPLSIEQQRLIKRASIDIKIINRESDENAKFDLFQRLNTGGSQLSDQEVRNAVLIMENPDYYRTVARLRDNEDFKDCTMLPDRATDEQYDLELILRFMALKDIPDGQLRKIGDLSDFLTERAMSTARSGSLPPQDVSDFESVFKIVYSCLNETAFRRFDTAKSKFLGGFTVSAYEAVTLGIHSNLESYENAEPEYIRVELIQKVKNLWQDPTFRNNSGMGVRANSRISKVIPFARRHFAL